VPAARGLGIGVHGIVLGARYDGPLPALNLLVGDRRFDVRWEWDPSPPATGSLVELAAPADTLRYFGTRQQAAGDADGEPASAFEAPRGPAG
jgi:hypothetical protein